jgi:hypothetical protein
VDLHIVLVLQIVATIISQLTLPPFIPIASTFVRANSTARARFGIPVAPINSITRHQFGGRLVNLQNMIRTQLLIAGVGLALSSAGGAGAQEITNTQFADGPYTEAFTQPIPANPGAADSQAPKTLATTGRVDNPSGNEPTKQWYPSGRAMWIGVAVVWVSLALGIYFASLARRFGPPLPSVASSQFNIKLD